jgi:hypothetical protein
MVNGVTTKLYQITHVLALPLIRLAQLCYEQQASQLF